MVKILLRELVIEIHSEPHVSFLNSHPITTRSKAGVIKLKLFFTVVSGPSLLLEPKSLRMLRVLWNGKKI